MSALYPVAEGSEAEELESDEANETVPPTEERDGEAETEEVLDGVITREELSGSQRNDDTLKQACPIQARGPNLTHDLIIFGPRDNFKCLLELARQYMAHAPLILANLRMLC